MKILIIGAGIAGCCAAIALAQDGHNIRVVEKQDKWRFQSSGIFVYANGLVCLEKLGLLPAILAAGFPVPDGRNAYFDHTGAPIVQTFYPPAAGGRIPAILGIKRAAMHRVMAARVDALRVPVELGTRVIDLKDEGDSVRATFSNGTCASFDLVIGADGLRSATRQQMGINVTPRYTGFGVWRAVHRRPPELVDKIMMMGPAKRFGIMPISDDLLYTFGTVAEPRGRRFDPAEWAAEMRARFSEFAAPAKPFLDDLTASSEVLFTAVEEVVLPTPWHRGRIQLIGDAAHASTPFMGQGGAMAMQDAIVLSNAIARKPTLHAALATFDAMRMPVCQYVQDVSRAVGEAGAREQDDHSLAHNADFRETAQSRVDGFYEHLAALNARADNALRA